MTEEQQDEPDSPSTQFDLTPHDDSVNEVLKELSDRIVAMEKRLQELEKMGKNLCTKRMEGETSTARNEKNEETKHDHENKLPSKSHEVSSQCNSTYPQHSSPLLSTYNDDEGDEHPILIYFQ